MAQRANEMVAGLNALYLGVSLEEGRRAGWLAGRPNRGQRSVHEHLLDEARVCPL